MKVYPDEIAAFQDFPEYIRWHDGSGSVFVLTKNAEVYPFGSGIFGCYCWDRKTYLRLKKAGVIFEERAGDDKLFGFSIKKEDLPRIFELGKLKRRPHRDGRWLKNKAIILGHPIFPLEKSPSRVKGGGAMR